MRFFPDGMFIECIVANETMVVWRGHGNECCLWEHGIECPVNCPEEGIIWGRCDDNRYSCATIDQLAETGYDHYVQVMCRMIELADELLARHREGGLR